MHIWRKWSVVAVAVIVTAVVMGIIVPGITLWSPHWRSAFGADTGSIMAATTFNQIGAALIAPFAGYAVGRISVRTLMLIGVALTATALIGVAFAAAMWQVTLLHTVALSAGLVLCGPAITQVLAVRLFQDNRGLAIGVVTAGAAVASFTIPPLIGWLLLSYDWRTVELIMAGLVAALAPLIFLVVRETPASVASDDAPEMLPVPTRSAREIVSDRVFLGVLMTMIPVYAVFNAIYFTLGFYLADLGASSADTAAMVSLMGFIALFSVVAFGGLADRISHWLLLAVAAIVLTVGYAVVATTQNYAVLLVVMPILSFMVGGLLSLGPAILAKRFGSADFARASGLSQPFGTLSAFSPLIAGILYDRTGDYSSVYLLMLSVLPISFLGLALLRFSPRVLVSATPAPT